MEQVLSYFLQEVAEALRDFGKLSITRHESNIFVEQKEVREAQGLVSIFEEHNIQSLTFEYGVTPPEVRDLVILLSRKKPEDNKDNQFSDWLRTQNVTHIHVNQTTIVEMLDEEKIVKKSESYYREMKSFPELEGSLKESFKMIDEIPEERRRQELKEHLAQRLAGLETSLMKEMFEKPLPESKEGEDVKEKVIEVISENKLLETFDEVIRCFRQIRSLPLNADIVKQIDLWKAFVQKLLTAPASKNMSFAVYDNLVKEELIQSVPQDIQEKPKDDASFQARQLLEKPPSAFLEGRILEQMTGLFETLLGEGLPDLAQKLLERFLKNLAEGKPDERHKTVVASGKLFAVFWAKQQKDLEKNLSLSLFKSAKSEEHSPMVYKELMNVLTQASIHYYRGHDYGRALKITTLMRKHAIKESPLNKDQTKDANQALHEISDKLLEVLVQDLLSNEENLKDTSRRLLADLGENAIPCFVEIIKTSSDIRARRLAAETLKTFGEAASHHLAAEFHIGNSTAILLNLLSVLDDFVYPELADWLAPFIYYQDTVVRKCVVKLLSRIDTEKARLLLVRCLSDPDQAIRIEAVRSIGEMKIQEAVQPLIDLLQDVSTASLEEVCLALGQIGHESAVGPLAKLLELKSGFLKEEAAVMEETVRIRAAWALLKINTTESKNQLSTYANDYNSQVREIVIKSQKT